MNALLLLPIPALAALFSSERTGADGLPAAQPVETLRSEPVALLPRGLTSFGAESSGGWLYVFGGYHGVPHRYAREGQSGEFLRLNLRDPVQIELLDGGLAIQGAPLVAHDGKLIRAGGMIARNAAGETADLHSISDAAVYDPRERAWTPLPALPEPRSSHDLDVVGERVVALGGWSLDGGKNGRFQTTAAVLDLSAPEAGWASIPAPFQRRALAAARLGERITAIGGIDPDGDARPTVDVFDPSTGIWSNGPDFPGSPFGVAACALGDSVLASGQDGAIWRLDPGAAAWQQVGQLAFPRFFHQMVAGDDGSAFVLGGLDEMRKDGGRVRHVERIQPERPGVAHVAKWSVPAPFPARNRQGAMLRGNRLTLFGGNRSLRQHDFAAEDFRAESWTLDLASLAWRPCAEFPEARQTIASAVAGDGATGFAIGGFGYADGRALARSAAWRTTPSHGGWERAPEADLPVPRTQFGLVAHAGALWVFGGLDYDPARGDDAFRHPVEVLELDLARPDARFVDSGARLPAPRRAFGLAALGGRAYLVGGMREEFELVEECEAFDFATRTFARIAGPARPRVSAELIALGERLYLCGGSSRGADGKLAPDPTIEVYDPAHDRWSALELDRPLELTHARAFALRDRLLLVSSHADGPPTTRIVLVTP